MKRIIILLGGVVLLFIIVMIGIMAFLVSSHNSYKGNYKTILGSNASSRRALVVFQPSISKASENIAKKLASGLNKSGYEVTLSYPGKHLSSDVQDYSVLVFGSTVYAGQPSKMIVEYMNSIKDYTGKKVVIYSVGSAKETPELNILGNSIKGSVFKKAKFITKDKNSENEAYQLGIEIGKE